MSLSLCFGTVALKYDLYAVLVHAGASAGYGHYYTYAKIPKGDWYVFNDSHVSYF